MPRLAKGSVLQRKQWLKDGLLKSAEVSFWQPFKGKTSDAIVYQEIDTKASTGHTIIYDYSGRLSGKAYKGDNVVYGRGEVKRKFSSTIRVEEFNLVVANGTRFDGVDADNLESTEHGRSRGMLSDLFAVHQDQALFDVAQGAVGTPPTHVYYLGNSFEYNDLIHLDASAKTGKNLRGTTINGAVDANITAKGRSPLPPFKTQDGKPIYLCVVDNYTANKLKSDPKYQTLVSHADIRGNNNRVLSMVVGRLGNIVYVEAPVFSGTTDGEGSFGLHDTEIDLCGLRQYGIKEDGTVVWQGQVEFDMLEERIATGVAVAEEAIYSRGLLLGAGALQSAMGMMPDYKLEWAEFQKSSESLLEFWGNSQKTTLKVETGSDYKGKVADIDFAIIAVDLKHTV